jgi:parvulin-like peptidyl-prolyl isomerase
MVEAFDAVAFDGAYKIGTVHGPVTSEFGFHLIVVHKRAGINSALLG